MSFDDTKISSKMSTLIASVNSETQFVYSKMPNVSSEILLSMIVTSMVKCS